MTAEQIRRAFETYRGNDEKKTIDMSLIVNLLAEIAAQLAEIKERLGYRAALRQIVKHQMSGDAAQEAARNALEG